MTRTTLQREAEGRGQALSIPLFGSQLPYFHVGQFWPKRTFTFQGDIRVIYAMVYGKANTSTLGATHTRITLGRKQEQTVNTKHRQKSRIILICLPSLLFSPH